MRTPAGSHANSPRRFDMQQCGPKIRNLDGPANLPELLPRRPEPGDIAPRGKSHPTAKTLDVRTIDPAPGT